MMLNPQSVNQSSNILTPFNLAFVVNVGGGIKVYINTVPACFFKTRGFARQVKRTLFIICKGSEQVVTRAALRPGVEQGLGM